MAPLHLSDAPHHVPARSHARMNAARDQSRPEEAANSLSHGLGLAAALVGAPVLLIRVAQRGDAALIAGAAVFCATVLLLYLASTLYHALPTGRSKRLFRVLDHASIYLLIAGTYTPFTLGVLRGAWGWVLFAVVWLLATVGVILKASGRADHPIISTALYLFMGWVVVIAADPMFAKVPTAGLLWLLAGGLFYTVGVAFFATDSRLRYGHLIWHVFVLGGTVCHYFAVLWYAV
jgi:hemolysin III